jgi:Tfp pilus assembly protein PilE
MDWEKQDNELRQLMDGADFLPDEERWNAVDGWRKLQQKRQPAKKGLSGYWKQLAAAASVVGILGFGLWWMQQENAVNRMNDVVDNTHVRNTIGGKMEAIEQSNVQQKPVFSDIPEKQSIKNNFNKETQALKNEVKQKSNNNISQFTVNSVPESKIMHHKDDESVAAIESKNEMDKNSGDAVAATPSATDSKPEMTSIAAVKKPKLRVVHYNELNGMQATAPPVFVLTKKSEMEWENLAVQNTTNQRSQPYSLKIDISPAPKKSL